MTVGELLSRCSARELTEWATLFKIEHAERQQASGSGNRMI